MPVHDWARVEAGIFHDFHNSWVAKLGNALNDGMLPPEFYALTEQHADRKIVDLLTLCDPPLISDPPPPFRQLRRTLVIRHVSGHGLVALIEIVSPGNKDRAIHVEELVKKIKNAIQGGLHVLLVDLFAPRAHNGSGLHGAIWDLLANEEPHELPGELLTLASYVGDQSPKAYLEHLTIGDTLPEMPLFLHPERYINIPLEPTYQAAFRGTPAVWRDVLEKPR